MSGNEETNKIAIGDIHGNLNAVSQLICFLESKYSSSDVVFLGDYVDRGKDSAGVIDFLIDIKEQNKFNSITFLRGNHEDCMLYSIKNPNSRIAQHWAMNMGGYETLSSYGWDFSMGTDFSMIPLSHMKFLKETKLYHQDKNYVFAHGGVNRDKQLSQNTKQELLWTRQHQIVTHEDRMNNKIVIHGHTPVDMPKFDPETKTMNIDVGSYFTDRICASVLTPDMEHEFILYDKGEIYSLDTNPSIPKP